MLIYTKDQNKTKEAVKLIIRAAKNGNLDAKKEIIEFYKNGHYNEEKIFKNYSFILQKNK